MGSIFQARTEYAARRLAEQARVLVDCGQELIHPPHTGQQIRVLQDALAAAASACAPQPHQQRDGHRRDCAPGGSAHYCDGVCGEAKPRAEIDLLPPVQARSLSTSASVSSSRLLLWDGGWSCRTQQAQAERDGHGCARGRRSNEQRWNEQRWNSQHRRWVASR